MRTIETPAGKGTEVSLPSEWNPWPSRGRILTHYVFYILPRIKRLLHFWQNRAGLIQDSELRRQAQASLNLKAFHCQGGAILALAQSDSEILLMRILVAYQTLCDYLDNLCDRAGELNGPAFSLLHRCLLAGLDPDRPLQDYYGLFPHRDDGGYILNLVQECRWGIAQLPSYPLVKENVLHLAGWYNQLQVNKHLSPDTREKCLKDWVDHHLSDYPEIRWNEWAAASGSTLAVFALLNLASRSNIEPGQVQDIVEVYFPWICGLHILLDYYIDQEEDRRGGDLNFISYYRTPRELDQRLKLFIREARMRTDQAPAALLDRTVVEGLLAMYLSDAKVAQQGLQDQARDFMRTCGGAAYPLYLLCRLVRKFL